MVTVVALVKQLMTLPDIYPRLTFMQLNIFLEVIIRFTPILETTSPRVTRGLPDLPQNILQVVALQTSLSKEDVTCMWWALGPVILAPLSHHLAPSVIGDDAVYALAKSAPAYQLGVAVMISDIRTCMTPGCPDHGKKLGGLRNDFAGHLFTHRRGVVPIRIMTLKCKACSTKYRPNYFVHRASESDSMRTYYGGIPQYLEVAEHVYIERELVVLFRKLMAFAHASGEVVARIYNLGLSGDLNGLSMTGEHVWNSFHLHALLRDHSSRQDILQVPHHIEQKDRFTQAIIARNYLMAGVGQPLWAHACDVCERITEQPRDPMTGDRVYTRVSACVMDGICIGHPRCNVELCTQRLRSPRDRFCPDHQSYEGLCAIVGCKAPCADGKRTCRSPQHRSYEEAKHQRGQAIYRLRRRLPRDELSAAIRSFGDSPEAGDDTSMNVLDLAEVAQELQAEDEADEPLGATHGPIPSPAAVRSGAGPTVPSTNTARSSIKSVLTRRWTHNEQLMVRPCGIVIARATFYDAESVSNAVIFMDAFFPKRWPGGRPSFIFFDNNCNVLRHLHASNNTGFDDIGLPVDVFHANTKHKDSDAFCQMWCNPAGFPELMDDNDEWIFNSSVAEQINVWFGKFAPIVREMSEPHHNFFLDEVLIENNEHREMVLKARGTRPRLVPLRVLEGRD